MASVVSATGVSQPSTPPVIFAVNRPVFHWAGMAFQYWADSYEVTELQIDDPDEFRDRWQCEPTNERAIEILGEHGYFLPDSVWNEGEAQLELDRARGLV